MLYDMTGGQAIYLEGGRKIEPGCGAFAADEREMPVHLAEWFQKIGAVRPAVAPVVAEGTAVEEPDRPMPRRRRPALAESEE